MNKVDENHKTIITEEMFAYFDDEHRSNFSLKKDIVDLNGNIKKGFEIFDLNCDGKFDDLECGYYSQNSGYDKGYNDLKLFLTALDKAGLQDGSADNVITKEDKQNVYNSLCMAKNRELYDKLHNLNIKDPSLRDVVTPQMLELFANNVSEVGYEDLLNKDGSIKSGFLIFNLNGDGKIDNKEKSFFSSGGHPISKDTSKLTLSSLVESLKLLDKFGYDRRYCSNIENHEIKSSDIVGLYKIIEALHYMLDTIKDFPENIRRQYADVLTEVYVGNYTSLGTIGISKGNTVSANHAEANKDELASVLIHEVTHYLLSKNGMKSSLLQEVETFYMEYQLYNIAKNNSGYMKGSANSNSIFTGSIIDMDYIRFIDEQKRINPDMSEKDLAVEAFIKYKYDSYNRYYNEDVSPEELRGLVKQTDNFIMLR